jgi:uncharacterized protein
VYNLPLFPLQTVLFPGGLLPLRVFETRYMDMVRSCMRENREFGVCLIKKGKEVAAVADPQEIGCRARITDWNMEQLGVLHITVVGTTRFRVRDVLADSNGLLRANTDPLEEEARAAIPEKFVACRTLLQRIILKMGTAEPGSEPGSKPTIIEPYQLEDATWVGNRLCEVLPIPLLAKQKLMELTDAPTRLSIVHQYLRQQKII